MNLNKLALTVLSTLALNNCAQASVIATVVGFVPLQYTENLSIADFYAGIGGWNQQYHLATDTEITRLLESYGIALHVAQVSGSNEWAFIRQIGGTALGPDGTYFSDGAQGIVGRSVNSFVSVIVSNGENSQAYGNCPAFRECTSPTISHGPQSLSYKDSQSGLFLVENSAIPEPASTALIALGFGALFLRRR